MSENRRADAFSAHRAIRPAGRAWGGLRDWIEKLKVTKKEPVAYDPAHLGDDIALRTDWGPAASGGSNFRTHRLIHAGPRRAEF